MDTTVCLVLCLQLLVWMCLLPDVIFFVATIGNYLIVFDAETTVGMGPPPYDPQAVDFTPLSALPCIPVQSSSHIAHTNISSKNRLINIQSDTRFGLVCVSHKVLE